jgi:alpha-beta hydrolase superfamily lysophospholipase
MFDFRAHGENKKTVTTIGCHEHKDVLAVAKWIKENKPKLAKVPVIILGVSMGGAAALRAAEKNQTICDALVIDSAFSSLKSVLYNTFASKSGLPNFPFLPIMETMFNYIGACTVAAMKPLESVKKIKKPLLLIHACIDNVVPVQESLLMYAQAAKTGAKLWIAPECKHGWLHKKYPNLYIKKVGKFLRKIIGCRT